MSGGERGRVSLAKLMLSEANFLILDEPTNHLDIASKEILENALNDYTGTVLYVSHDRYFINQTASRILDLVNHTFVNYIGNYDYYLEKKKNSLLHMPEKSLHLHPFQITVQTRMYPSQNSAGRSKRKPRQDFANVRMSLKRLKNVSANWKTVIVRSIP